jgi:hypothetical protein
MPACIFKWVTMSLGLGLLNWRASFFGERPRMLGGLLRESALLCCAQSCSAVDKQRTSREPDCLESNSYER